MAHGAFRKYMAHLEVDCPLYNDHNAMKKLVQSGEILVEVEKVVACFAVNNAQLIKSKN